MLNIGDPYTINLDSMIVQLKRHTNMISLMQIINKTLKFYQIKIFYPIV
jgi:hypothetical protein